MTKNSIIIFLLALLVGGCATLKPLTPQEASAIQRIYIQPENTGEVEYVRLGATIFNNTKDEFDGIEYYDFLLENTKMALLNRGYELTDNKDNAQFVLRVVSDMSYNYPSEKGVNGAGFFTQAFLGINSPISAQASFDFFLVESVSEKLRVVKSLQRSVNTEIKGKEKKWLDYSESDRAKMLAILKKEIATIPEEVIPKLGL